MRPPKQPKRPSHSMRRPGTRPAHRPGPKPMGQEPRREQPRPGEGGAGREERRSDRASERPARTQRRSRPAMPPVDREADTALTAPETDWYTWEADADPAERWWATARQSATERWIQWREQRREEDKPAGRKASSAPLDLEEHRRAARAKRRRLRLRRLGMILGAIAAVCLIVYALFFSPLFSIKAENVAIESTDPASVLPAEDVAAIARMRAGTPVLRVDTEALEAELESLTEVKDALVVRDFPSGLTVRVIAREPVACLVRGEDCVAVDAQGVELPEAKAAGALPKISGEASDRMPQLLDAMAALPKDVRERIAGAAISETGLIEFDLGGPVVKWGQSEDNEKKAEVLALLITQEASTYDVSIPTSPVTY